MILGGWGVDRPILIRSDGIVCSNNHSSQDGLDPSWHPSWYPNLMPKYPQVSVSFSILYILCPNNVDMILKYKIAR